MIDIFLWLLLSLLLFYSFESLSHQRLLIVFHWSLSDSKSPQAPWTLYSILDIPAMLLFGWSPLIIIFPSPHIPVLISWRLYRAPQLQLILVSPPCSIVFFSIITIIIIIILFLSEFFTPAFASTGVWVTASLLKSPGLFSVFWPI